MRVELNILNKKPDYYDGLSDRVKNAAIAVTNPPNDQQDKPNWYMHTKSYECDNIFIDDDIVNCTTGHNLDRLTLNDIQITSVTQIDKIIKLLENAKPCF